VLIAAALAVGALVGVLAGLTGVGGGVLMVPFLYLLYARLHVPESGATALAHATSLAVILPTAIRGLIGFRGKGVVNLRAAIPIAIVAAATAAIMAPFAARLPGHALRVGFGLFLLVVSVDLILRTRERDEAVPPGPMHVVGAAFLGLPVGALSAALGVGGGIPATMGMYYLLKLPFRIVAPTSLVVIGATAAAGTVSYLFTPTGPLAFGWVVGHVDFGHALPLALGSVLTAPLGVRLNLGMPGFTLRRIFGGLLAVMGVFLVIENLLR